MHIKLHEKSHSKEWLGFYDKSDLVLYQRCQYPDGNKCERERYTEQNVGDHTSEGCMLRLTRFYPNRHDSPRIGCPAAERDMYPAPIPSTSGIRRSELRLLRPLQRRL